MSIAAEQPKARRKRRSERAVPGSAAASRVVQPMPAPGETALVGLGDWATYLSLDKVLSRSGHRVRYFNGVLEIMSISFKHESLSGNIGRLLEEFCQFAGIDYQIWGSTTQAREGSAAGEPDESYTFGIESKDRPELIIEVGLSSGGIDKLEFWATLGAKEVWVWQNDRLHGFARAADDRFHPVTVSQLLPGLSLALVQEFAVIQPSSRAVRAFRDRLQTTAP
jgi:Uma2 family endonuclease